MLPSKMTMDNALKSLGERIRNLREGQGLSRARFSAKCAISPSHILSIEHGRKVIKINTLFALAHCLGTTAAHLLAGLDPFGGGTKNH